MGRYDRIDRRTLLGGLAAALALPLNALAQNGPDRPLDSAAIPGLHFRAIEFDYGPMAAKGVRAQVELMRRFCPPALNKAFAGRVTPGDRRAPLLRVVLDSASFANDGGGYDELTPALDMLEGTGLVIGPNGAVLASYPLLASMDASTSLRYANVQGYDLRAQLLAESFASWMRRKIGV